jgi:hypothetical protein
LQAPPHTIAQVVFGVLHTHKRSFMRARIEPFDAIELDVGLIWVP